MAKRASRPSGPVINPEIDMLIRGQYHESERKNVQQHVLKMIDAIKRGSSKDFHALFMSLPEPTIHVDRMSQRIGLVLERMFMESQEPPSKEKKPKKQKINKNFVDPTEEEDE